MIRFVCRLFLFVDLVDCVDVLMFDCDVVVCWVLCGDFSCGCFLWCVVVVVDVSLWMWFVGFDFGCWLLLGLMCFVVISVLL